MDLRFLQGKKGTFYFFYCGKTGRYAAHGKDCKSVGRWCLLPCHQSRKRAEGSVPHGGGLCGLRRPDGGSKRAVADAGGCLVPCRQSFSRSLVATRRWGLEPMDAMVADFARAPIPPSLSCQRTRLAGAFQGISHCGGRALVERSAVRGTQCPARNLVRRAEDWRWSSAAMGHGGKYAALRTGQLPFPTQYNLRVVRMNNWPWAALIEARSGSWSVASSIGITRSSSPRAALRIATSPLKLIR